MLRILQCFENWKVGRMADFHSQVVLCLAQAK
jgi:hypothetical protein